MRTKLVEVKAGAKAAVIDAAETLQYQITQEAKQEQDLVSATAGLEVIARNSTRRFRISSRTTPRNWRTPNGARKTSRSAWPRLAELDHLTLRAPIAGRVQSSIITNVGQVVASGQEISAHRARGSGLEIQAYVRNRDIGFVSVGQEAVVKVELLPFTRYGSDSCACFAHRQGRHSRARRQRDRGRSDARLQRCRFRRRRAHAKSRVPGGA